MNRKIELLAPAGSFDAFIGAVNGGADAVYLAGDRFGARAYADNFTQEEILEALFIAKLHGVKIYLTVNTLLKNKEMNELYDYIAPLYEAGLDGVIIQDFGVLSYLYKQFPALELHASTQMTVTSVEGAKFLKKNHVKRVVLARELTLDEIKAVVAEGIETECFIHGSMCYCYSGQCLFSSLIGGRSGNRGRCAQPCRLPYHAMGGAKESYVLSLKDMCTLEHIPALVESGIASFKIEGRMKNPAYAAWVTHIYRKYIDRYLQNPSAPYCVEPEDLMQLKNLYIRTSLQDGYYHTFRGKNMITMDNPAYSKTDEDFVAYITESMIRKPVKKTIFVAATFHVGQPCSIRVSVEIDGRCFHAAVFGDDVQVAVKAPLTEETVREKLIKTGDTPFAVERIDIWMDENAFLPVKSINEIRRSALAKLCENIRAAYEREMPVKIFGSKNTPERDNNCSYIVFVEEKEQLRPVLTADYVNRIVLPYGWLLEGNTPEWLEECKASEKEIFYALPAVCRNASYDRIRAALNFALKEQCCDGVYVNQVDSMAFCKHEFPALKCVGDINLYATNPGSIDWLDKHIDGFTISVELKKEELKHLPLQRGEMILYGRTPLMHTANCIFLTKGSCRKNSNMKTGVLKDRTNAEIPFRGHCEEYVCYNTVYNSIPTSLHKHVKDVEQLRCNGFQLRFTTETEAETKDILNIYRNCQEGGMISEVEFAYTNGHFGRGVQ